MGGGHLHQTFLAPFELGRHVSCVSLVVTSITVITVLLVIITVIADICTVSIMSLILHAGTEGGSGLQ